MVIPLMACAEVPPLLDFLSSCPSRVDLQDTDRGVVVGERTYGKGLVQVVEPLPGGGSLKLTVAK